jgi:hypothetical protein
MYRGTNTMTVVSQWWFRYNSAINGSQAQTDQQDGPIATGRVQQQPTFTPPSTVAGNNLLQGLINAANNGCDQAVSNNARQHYIT